MRKTLIIGLMSAFFLTGCGETFNNFDVDDKNIISIRLNNELIPSDKYDEIDGVLESIGFSSKKITTNNDFAELTIKTGTESYLMKIYNNETITFLDIDNKMYYATDKNKITSLLGIIADATTTEDNDTNLVNIEYINEYTDITNDVIIADLETTLEAYKLSFTDDVDSVTIYGTTYKNNILDKTDVLYEKKDITKDQQLVIKTNTSEAIPKILIYIIKGDTKIVITPKYSGIDGKITFDKKIEKNNL